MLGECIATAQVDIEMLAPWLASWLADPKHGVDLDTRRSDARGSRRLGSRRHRTAHTRAPDAAHRHHRRASPSRRMRPAAAGSAQRRSSTGPWSSTTHLSTRRCSNALLRRAPGSSTSTDDGCGSTAPRHAGLWPTSPSTAAITAELSTLELLRLAAELAATEETRPAVGAVIERDRSARSTTTARRSPRPVGSAISCRACPTTALAEGVEPPGFMATLRPYQRRGLGWLQFLYQLGLGGCLADDMGLGKTPTTLAHLSALPGPHLVICPLSVVRNWEAEAARFTPLLRVAVHHGTGRSGAATFANIVAQHDLIITTYHVAARDIETLQAVQWTTVVFDEAQAVKNPETRTAKALRTLPAAQHIALDGHTGREPAQRTVVDHVDGHARSARQPHPVPPALRHARSNATTTLAAAEALRRLTSPFLLRRTKADKSLVPDLPDKVEQLAWASLTREQASMYQGVVDQLLADAQQATGMRRRGLVLAALTRLKQICNHPAHALGDGSRLGGRSGKLTRFDELVTDLLDAGEQALVFTQFREMGLLLQRHLLERFALPTPFLHGGVPRKGRDRMVDEFQTGSASPLLLVSLRAGGTGLNLTAASRVVHYDRWWNPAVEDQATDRAWRIGQHARCSCTSWCARAPSKNASTR